MRNGCLGIASSPGEAGSSHHGDADRLERENATGSSSYRVHGRFGRERYDVGKRNAKRREIEQHGYADEQRL